MMLHAAQAGLTALAVAGPVERVVRPQRAPATRERSYFEKRLMSMSSNEPILAKMG
jgi:hypothetical protein